MVENFSLSNITTYQAGAAQAAMHRQVQKMSDDILRPFGLTKMQWMIIGCVLEAGIDGARISDLSKKLGTTIAYLTNTINVLETRNILKRRGNELDNRSKLVTVVPGYVEKCHEIENVMRDELRKSVYSKIDPEDFTTYFKVVFQLIDVGKADDIRLRNVK